MESLTWLLDWFDYDSYEIVAPLNNFLPLLINNELSMA